jgi:hypothetical protein
MSATATEPLAFGVREQAALDHLRPALADAVARNRPVAVNTLPKPLDSDELVALAVRLCSAEQANVAVLPLPVQGVIFVPV